LAIVRQQKQTRGVLIEAADGLHALDDGFGGALAQGGGQQAVGAGPSAGAVAAFETGGFVQHQVSALVVFPALALDSEFHPVSYYDFSSTLRRIYAGKRLKTLHKPLLNQAGADASRAKALAKEQIIQPHGD
jgi:hypothetical protein